MKPFIFFFGIFLFLSTVICEANGQVPVNDSTAKPYIAVDHMPQFPGGESALTKYLREHVRYPDEARKNNITGRVYVAFVVDKVGDLKNIRILQGIGGGCDEEVLRVVKSMPAWIPGSNAGIPVPVQYNLPVNFSLRDSAKRKPVKEFDPH